MAKADYNFQFMIVMIGDSSVGKSCLLKKFVEPESQMSFHDNHQATVGVDFIVRNVNVDGHVIKLQVWDTAGQERFRSVTSAYYRGAMGAVVCYDPLEESSWRNTDTWMAEFTQKAKDGAPLCLIATKKDMIDTGSARGDVVSASQGQEMADRYNASFLETSAFTGENVNQAFETVCRRILQQKGLGQSENVGLGKKEAGGQKIGAKNENTYAEQKKGCC